MNEPIFNGTLRKTIWSENFGESYISEALTLARKTDPKVKLYINEYHSESISSKSTYLYNLVKRLKAKGVPIDGIGFQGHLSVDTGLTADFERNLKRFVALGVEVAITELDVRSSSDKYAEQAKIYAKVYQICEDVPKCVGVTVWGFTDKYSYAKGSTPCMWDKNFQAKPAVAAVAAVLK